MPKKPAMGAMSNKEVNMLRKMTPMPSKPRGQLKKTMPLMPLMKKTLPKKNVPIKRAPLRPAGRKYA